MKYLLAPTAAAIAILAGCATVHNKPKPLGCRPSGADILLNGEVAKRDMMLCFNADGTLAWQLGPQKPVEAKPELARAPKKAPGNPQTNNKETAPK